MKLLFDQGTLIPLKNHLPNHIIETAYEKGWSNLKNGDLLNLAEAEGFDVLVTTDQNLRYQQNLSRRRIGVIVLMVTNWPRIKKNVTLIIQAIDKIQLGSYEEIDFP